MKGIKLFLVVILLLNIFIVTAQEEEPLYTRAGFKIGINNTNIVGDLDDTDSRYRIHIGAVIEFPVTQRFYIQAEVMYSGQGYKEKSTGVKNKISLNYLALPIINKYYITENISIETGPRFAILNNAKNSIDNKSKEFFNSFNNFEFSWSFGTGYKLESGMFLQLRYNLGISEINSSSLNTSNKNSVFQLSVGYLFKTKNNRRQLDEDQD